MTRPRQLARSLAATARLGRAVSKALAAAQDSAQFAEATKAVYASPANRRLNARLARHRRTEMPARFREDR